MYSKFCTQSCKQKTSPSLYFCADFKNLHAFLMRIISQFHLLIKSKPDHCSLICIIFKVRNQNWLLSIFIRFQRFSCHSYEICLTNLNMFSNLNLLKVALMATILVCCIEFPCQTEHMWMTHHVIFFGWAVFSLPFI